MPTGLRRDLRLYHDGKIALGCGAIERRLFGSARPPADAPLGETLLRLGLHKFEEDAPRYDIIRAGLGLLPRRDISVLDIGSGRGRVLLYAALLGARRATGIEILEGRAALARRAAARLAPEAVTVIAGDALTLPWPKAQALIVMNPFYPAQYRRLRRRLLDYARGRPLPIIAASTLYDRLAADRRFALRRETSVEWVKLGMFEAERI